MVPGAHEMTAPWGLRFGPLSPEAVRRHHESLGLAAPAWHPEPVRGSIVAVIRGSCCLEVEEHGVKEPLSGGDVVLVTRNAPVVLRDDWRTPATDVLELVGREQIETLSGLRGGGGGVATTFLSGAFTTEGGEGSPLLAGLPPVICIRGSEPRNAPWLEGTLKILHGELAARAPGSQSVVNHLAHVLFAQAVRAYAAALPEGASGNWFRAIFDSELATALGMIHARPADPWTVASLAEASGIGRSSFAARFAAAVGQPPLQYLTDFRMRKAREMLRTTRLGVKTIATGVGYSNESAFSSAFRRFAGVSPGAYRQSRAAPQDS